MRHQLWYSHIDLWRTPLVRAGCWQAYEAHRRHDSQGSPVAGFVAGLRHSHFAPSVIILTSTIIPRPAANLSPISRTITHEAAAFGFGSLLQFRLTCPGTRFRAQERRSHLH